LSMKAKPAVDIALEALKNGQKPVLTIANTMESFLNRLKEEEGLKTGDLVDMDFSDLLNRYLERQRWITIRKPFGKVTEKKYLTDEELGSNGVAVFNAVKNYISSLDLSSLPISPIDYMQAQLKKKGYSSVEITGRSTTIDYSGPTPKMSARPANDLSIEGRNRSRDNFNDGKADVIFLNQAGATGLSLHASSKFKDQRQRHMILVQPEANIDTHMQMLGRVHRTGQVIVPQYSQIIANIPAEKRPAAVLAKKMASLNANTTASRKGALTAENVPDFLNEYGDAIAKQFLIDNPELMDALDISVAEDKKDQSADNTDLMRKLTGRMVLLPLTWQEEVYHVLETAYSDLMTQLEAQGINTLEAKSVDLDAKLVEEKVMKEGTGDSPFEAPVMYGEYDVKRQGKPITMNDAISKVYEAQGEDETSAPIGDLEALNDISNKFYPKQKQIYNTARSDFKSYERAILDDVEPERRSKEEDRLNFIRNAFNVASDILIPGRRVRMTYSDGSGNMALIVNVSRGGKTKNPLALGDWKVTFATPSANPMLTIPFSQLQIGGEYGQKTVITPPHWADNAEMTAKIFNDLANSSMREKRIIATGNILAGFDTLNGRGTIINFTTNTGEVRQGIMLPLSVKSLDDAVSGSKTYLNTPEEVRDALITGDGHRQISTTKGDISIRYDPYQRKLYIDTPKAKDVGGKYYLNKDLINLVGDFSGRGVMTAIIYNPKTSSVVLPAIQKLLDLGAKFETTLGAAEGKDQKKYAAMQQLKPETDKVATKLYDDFAAIVERTLGDKAVVKFVDSIEMMNPYAAEASGGVQGGQAAGALDDLAGIIYLATDLEKGASPEDAVYHEGWHIIEKMLTPEERKSMDANRAKNAIATAKFYGVPVSKILSLSPSEQDAYAMGMFGAEMDAGRIPTNSMIPQAAWKTFHKGWLTWKRFRNEVKKTLGNRDAKSIFTDFYFGAMRDRMENTIEEIGDRIDSPNVEYMAMRRKRKAPAGTTFDMPKSHFGKELLYGLVEKYNDIREVQKAIEAFRGSPLPDTMDAYLALQLYSDKAINRQNIAWENEIKPMLEALKASKISDKDLAEYMYAAHAPHRNTLMAERNPKFSNFMGSGMRDSDAQDIMDNFAKEGKLDELQRIAKKYVYPMLQRDIRDRYNAGLLTEGQYREYSDQSTAYGRTYVPLTGFAEDEGEAGQLSNVGRGFSLKGKEFQSAVGRTSRSRNPLINSIQKRMDGIVRVQKAVVDKALYQLVENNPNPEFATIMNAKNVPRRRVLSADGTVHEVPDFGILNQTTSLPVKINGQQHYIVFNDENPNMVRLVSQLKNLNENGGALYKAVLNIGRFMSKIQTSWVPDFFLTHFPRTIEDTLLSMYGSKEGLATGFMKELANSGKIIGSVLTGKKLSKQDQAIYDEWRLSGGRLDYGGFENVNRAAKKIDEEMRGMFTAKGAAHQEALRLLKKAGTGTLSALEHVNELFESTTRLAVYIAARKHGYTKERAAQLSRQSSVDYRAKGAWMPALNALKPFLSVTIGTARSFARLAGTKRGRNILLAIIALSMANSLMGLWASDDDEADPTKKKFYTGVREYERQKNIILPFHNEAGNFARIPLGFFLIPFWTLGDQIVGAAFGQVKPMDAAINVMTSVATAYEGIPGLGGGSIVRQITPGFIQPFLDTYYNKDWLDHPIHPEVRQGRENIPESGQASRSTSETAKTIADELNRLSGGDAYHKGYLDTFPGNLDYWAEFLTGATGTFAKNSWNAINNGLNGIETPYEKLPFVRRLVTNPEGIQEHDYYTMRDDIKNKENQMSAAYHDYRDDHSNIEAKTTYKEIAKELHMRPSGDKIETPAFSLPGIIKKADSKISDIRDKIDEVQSKDNLSAKEKADQVSPLKQKMLEIQLQTRRRVLSKSPPEPTSPLMQMIK